MKKIKMKEVGIKAEKQDSPQQVPSLLSKPRNLKLNKFKERIF